MAVGVVVITGLGGGSGVDIGVEVGWCWPVSGA